MSNIFNEIEKKFKLFKTVGANKEQIREAEKELGLIFPSEYSKYLEDFGAISFGSVEITGLNIDNYANVVNLTKKERERDPDFPKDAFVIQNTGIDGVIVLMNESGLVFFWQNGKIGRSFKSLNDYLLSLI